MTSIQEKNKLLDETAKLNKGLEEYYVLLAVKLVEVSETEAWREAGYDTWPSYYTQELGRERSTVSRLLTVGKYMKENMLHAGNIKSYKRLAQAISQNPGEDPQKVLAIAATWSSDDFKAQAKEECSHPDPAILCCPHCWATMAK